MNNQMMEKIDDEVAEVDSETARGIVNPHCGLHDKHPKYQRILNGWFSKFNNRMDLILMIAFRRNLSPLRIQTTATILDFLNELRGHYSYLNIGTMPAIEFLISTFERYPNVSQEDIRNIEDAVNQIYDGFEMTRPSEIAAITAEQVAKEKARLGREF